MGMFRQSSHPFSIGVRNAYPARSVLAGVSISGPGSTGNALETDWRNSFHARAIAGSVSAGTGRPAARRSSNQALIPIAGSLAIMFLI